MSLWMKLLLAACCMFQLRTVHGDFLQFGAGFAPQSLLNWEAQHNGVVDVSYFFYESEPTDKGWLWLCGAGYSYIFTDATENNDTHLFSILPGVRKYLTERGRWQPFFEVVIGPSYSSERFLGGREQGAYFIFNDFVSLGTTWGEDDEWEIKYTWRHVSNGNFFPPNPGWDIPFTLHLARRF